jgi:hypothetical protein
MVVNTRRNRYDVVKKIKSPKICRNYSKECPICYEKMGANNYIITNCNHKFCNTCLFKSLNLNSKCPICRNEIFKFNKIKQIGAQDLRHLHTNITPVREQFIHIIQKELKNIIEFSINNNICSCTDNETKEMLLKYFNCTGLNHNIKMIFSNFINTLLIKYSGICYRNIYEWLKE